MLHKMQLKLGGVLLCLLMCGGCALFLLTTGAALGIGAYQWKEGTMEKDYPRPMQPVWHACLDACKTMQLTVQKESYNPLSSFILAAKPDGTSVDIQMVARPNDITTVRVRFGFMGNKDQSAYFHRRVMASLGMQPG